MRKTWIRALGREDPLGKGKAAHASTDKSVHRQGAKDSGLTCVSHEFAIVTGVIQAHPTAPHNRTGTRGLLRVKSQLLLHLVEGPEMCGLALGCRRLLAGWREPANPSEPPHPQAALIPVAFRTRKPHRDSVVGTPHPRSRGWALRSLMGPEMRTSLGAVRTKPELEAPTQGF